MSGGRLVNALKGLLVSSVRRYLLYSPLKRGQGSVKRFARRMMEGATVKVRLDGKTRLLLSFPEDFGYEKICLSGSFETGTTTVLKKLVLEDDVILDIGANIGYYTTLFAAMVPKGHCHAFEPVEKIYEKLVRNCKLNGLDANISLNRLALGNREADSEMYTFSTLPHGHSSLSRLGRKDFTASTVSMITLDRYMLDNDMCKIDIVKVDAEGAEMMVLEGASRVFDLPEQPVWIFEMNDETSGALGFSPVNLLEYLLSKGEYRFCRIKRAWGETVPMDGLSDFENGDNVLCVPPNHWRRLKRTGIEDA